MQLSTQYPGGKFLVTFRTASKFLKNELSVAQTSSFSGYVTSPGYDGVTASPSFIAIHGSLTGPDEIDAMMINFERLYVKVPNAKRCRDAHLTLSTLDKESNAFVERWKECTQENLQAEVYHTTAVKLFFKTYSNFMAVGFLMRYSFHNNISTPRKQASGMFDCDVSFYSDFQQHLHCNLEQECEDGRDELGTCPCSSTLCGGKGAVSSSSYKCFSAVVLPDSSRSEMGIL
jgi:hypothetical protein